MANEKRLVWDLPLRLFHWLLALSILASYLTSQSSDFVWMQRHMYIGYWTLGLIIFRIIWGFVGPKHARFSNFLPSPAGLIRYLRETFRGKTIHTVGHNPAGSIMVIVMLALVAFQVGTGLFASDDIFLSGPYNALVTSATGRELTILHSVNFNYILAAIALHIIAILLYRIVKKQKLVGPMISGKKPAENVPASESISGSQLGKALVVVLISAAIVWAVLYFAPPPPSFEY